MSLVDDFDPSVEYSGDWQSKTDSQLAYNKTEHSTNSSTAKATITFTGTYILPCGGTRSGNPRLSCSVDGGPPMLFTLKAQVRPDTCVGLCDSSVQYGPHTLSIAKLDDTTNFYLDSFIVRTNGTSTSISPGPTPVTSSDSISDSSSSSSGTGSSSSSNVLVTHRSSTPSSDTSVKVTTSSGSNTFLTLRSSSTTFLPAAGTVEPSSPVMGNKSLPTATIIGAVAGLALVASCIIVYFWIRRRRNLKRSDSWLISSFSDSVSATPCLPAVTRQLDVNEDRPPSYAPPMYGTQTGPAAHVNSPRRFAPPQPAKFRTG